MTSELTLANFAASVPVMSGGNTAYAARYARELREVAIRQAHRSPRSVQRSLGPSELGHTCLSGDTEVVTRTGLRRIADLATEGEAELIVPLLYSGSDTRKRWGKFQRVPVTCFGEQELFKITLHRNQETKVVYTTAEHKWFRSYWSRKTRKQERLETRDLRPGHKLAQLRRAMPRSATLMPVAVAQGFVFGDGTKGSSDSKHRPAVLRLFHNGKDEALLPFFPGEHSVYHDPGHAHAYTYIQCLPRFWKELPPADESSSFLMSWLAGYFAADGSVGEDGHCEISSANREHLEFVRDIAAICGIGYGQVKQYTRHVDLPGKGRQENESTLYRLSLRRRDLPTWFFLTERHLQRVKASNATQERDPHWIVKSVEPTGRVEPVYCATVYGAGAFALADDLMTGNCHRLVIGKMSGQQVTNHVSDPWPSIVGTAVHAQLAEYFNKENAAYAQQRWITEARVAANVLLAHPGTADLYDGHEFNLVDHKCLAPTSMAKVMSAAGPPWHYVIQMLIYAQGYRDFGYRVDRVILAAWPRTAPTLDSMYCWERPYVPAVDDDILRQVAATTAARREVASRVMAGRIPIDAVPRTPGDECFYCFAGDTEVVTRDGIKPIRELAGTEPELLVPRTGMNPGLEAQGDFVPAPVRSFGQQRLWKITLASRGAEKTVYATAEHRWFLTARPSRAKDPAHPKRPPTDRWPERTTSQLRPGDRLRPLRAFKPTRTAIMPPAVAQGFVFGDGTKGSGNRPATLAIYDNGKDEALLPFFPLTEPAQYEGVKHIYGLPRFWKDLPPVRESRAFLVSWLAGYFAADGSVGEGGQVTLCSASEQAIRFARDVASVCGIGYSPVRSKMRVGYGTEATRLWSIDFRRRDLPSWFFLIKDHAVRAATANTLEARGTYWTVKSAELTDQVEEVFCATVPGAGAFGLADDLLTGNCPWFRPQSARDGGPGCPGHSAKT